MRARHDDIVQVSIILTSYLGLFSFSHTRHRHREQREHVQCRANCVLKKSLSSSPGRKIIRRRVVKFSGQIKISNNALQIQRVSAIIPVKPFCHKTLKSLPGSLAGAGKMTATAMFGDLGR